MGKSGKTKAKSAGKAEAKAAKKAKLASKAERKENKKAGATSSKGATAGSSKSKSKGKGKAKEEDDEEDLIQTLEEYRRRWEEDHKTTEEVADIPSRRANATLTACPVSSNNLWLYGGEYFDGTDLFVYGDLYRYNTEKNEWRKLSSPTQPSPRSAHQIVASPAGGGKLWLFGGEYAAQNQSSFHHYRDLWCFDITTRAWERFDTKLKPSARSGHRMTIWKHYIILFGGFHDVGIRTTYLSDLWLWDTLEYKWHEVQIRETDRRPPARSGFSFIPSVDGAILHGGYCKEYQGKQVKGVALDDTWLLRMDAEPSKIKWERRKKVGYAPSVRSGVQMAHWASKGIGISFGGVFDSYDAEDDDLTSVFFNELFGYQITVGPNGKWISMNLKKPKQKKKGPNKAKLRKLAQQQREQEERERREEDGGSEDEEASNEGSRSEQDEDHDDEDTPRPDSRNAEQPSKGEVLAADGQADSQYRANGGDTQQHNGAADSDSDEDSDDPDDPQKSIPIARYNVMMAVQRNTLYVYGGIVESHEREYTLDDFYTLQLDKLDRFTCLKECNIAELEWKESDDDDSDDSDSDDSDSDDDSDGSSSSDGEGVEDEAKVEEGANAQETKETVDAEEESKDAVPDAALREKATAFMGVAKNTERSADDVMSTPLPGETLRTFYDRTREYWAQKAHEHSENRGKELRRDGFQLANDKYDTYKPILDEIERIRAEALLDEADASKGSATKASGLGVDSRHRR